MEAEFNRVAIIGLGLIGGSLAAGMRQQGLARTLIAWDANYLSLSTGRDLGIIDEVAADVAAATNGADLVILCVPVKAMKSVLQQIEPGDQIITDVGSVKTPFLEEAREVFGEVPARLIPGHPIAGSERHGVTAADPNLFARHRVILTPAGNAEADAVSRVEALWQGLGAQTIQMSAEHHDDVLAQTSHLPHLLAYALVDTLSSGGDSLEVFEYAAGGFRDFSRIAASDPTMWSDIFQANREPLLKILDRYMAELTDLRALVSAEDGDAMKEVFSRAKAARDHFSTIDRSRNA
jgi:3-phosphoshikimate 1-carboxyvinyltransferase